MKYNRIATYVIEKNEEKNTYRLLEYLSEDYSNILGEYASIEELIISLTHDASLLSDKGAKNES